MKTFYTATAIVIVAAFAGCNQGTSGGPGASNPPEKQNMLSQADDTFSLAIASTDLKQGETTAVPVEISRGKNFNEDVAVAVSGLPKGVTLSPRNAGIKHSETSAMLSLVAAEDAALGEFTAKLTGHPTKGADATTELKLNVEKRDAIDVSMADGKQHQENRVEYTTEKQAQLDEFTAQYTKLGEGLADAEGQVKIDLNQKLANAKIKLDAAANKLNDLKTTGADSWDKSKVEVDAAFDDLKNALA